MLETIVIDVVGGFTAVAVALPHRFRFQAVDPRLDDLEATERSGVAELRRERDHGSQRAYTRGRGLKRGRIQLLII